MTVLLLAWAVKMVLIIAFVLCIPAIVWLALWVAILSLNVPKQKRAPRVK